MESTMQIDRLPEVRPSPVRPARVRIERIWRGAVDAEALGDLLGSMQKLE